MDKKIIAIILGNRLNDDGTITEIQEDRLKMAMEIEELFNPNYIILSGGPANPVPGITEAEAMYNYLVNAGINKDKLVLEKNSYSTVENAKYSVPIALELGAEIIIVCSSAYHFENPGYKLVESFVKQLNGHNVVLMSYCK